MNYPSQLFNSLKLNRFLTIMVLLSLLMFDKLEGQICKSSLDIEDMYILQSKIASNGDLIILAGNTAPIQIGTTTLPYNPNANYSNLICFRIDTSGTVIWHNNLFLHNLSTAEYTSYPIMGFDSILQEIWIGFEFMNTLVIGNQTLSSGPFPSSNSCLIKLNAVHGGVLKVIPMNGTVPKNIAIISDGSIIISGQFNNTVTLQSTTIIGTLNDGFLFKLDSAGNAIWGKRMSSPNVEYPALLCSLTGNRCMVTFKSDTSTVNFGNQSIGGTTNPGLPAVYICIIDSAGNLISVHTLEGVISITCLYRKNNGNILIGGDYLNTFTWGSTTLQVNANDTSVFIGHYLQNNQLDWVKSYSGKGIKFIVSIDEDNNNNLLISGAFRGLFEPVQGLVMSAPLYDQAYILKTNNIGQSIWSQQIITDEVSQGNNGIINPFNSKIYFIHTLQANNYPMGYTIDTTQRFFSAIDYASAITEIEDSHNKLSGKLYVDSNSNGQKDPGEYGISNKSIQISAGFPVSSSNTQGQYTFYLPAGNYGVQLSLPIQYYNVTTNPLPQVTFTGTGQIDTTAHIGINAPAGLRAKSIQVTKLSLARAGKPLVYHLTAFNNGSTTQTDTVTAILDANLSFTSSVPAPSIQSGQTLIWYLNSFLPLTNEIIQINTFIPSSIPIGTNITSQFSVSSIPNDLNPGDNLLTDNTTTIGPYDPNYKSVSRDQISPNELSQSLWLSYVIHFQNLGNDTAFYVGIVDTLSSYLQWKTMEIVSSSHPCTFLCNPAGQVKFIFPNINLPSENIDPIASCGFIQYRIKPQNAIPLGETINNFAEIYFDYNAPIRTNTTSTLITYPLSRNDSNSSSLRVYPNPVQSDYFNIEWLWPGESGRVEIYSVSGVKISDRIIEGMIDQGLVTIPIPNFLEGIYFGKVLRNHEIYNFKFVVESKR